MRTGRVLLVVGLLIGTAAAATPADAAPRHALIQGTGSSWAANAVNQWVADATPSGLQVVYTGSGSAQGRQDFRHDTTDYAVTDLPFAADEQGPVDGQDTARAFAYAPLLGGGTSFPYQLRIHGELVKDLRLSGATLAGIFTGHITTWNDKLIRADNNGRILPNLRIVPVVHTEGSAVSFHVSEYFAHEYPTVWRNYAGSTAPTTYWPRLRGAEPQSGSDGVMNFVTSKGANGAIGMDEYAYALAKGFPVAKVRNRAGYFVAPNAGNVSIALRGATAAADAPADLRAVFASRDPRSYPLSSYSYAVVPTGKSDGRMTTAKRQTIVDFLQFGLCGEQRYLAPVGYAPLPLNLVRAGFSTLARLEAADPNVDVSHLDLANCKNPTFGAGDPPKDTLDRTVAHPAACDRSGHGPCLLATQSTRLTLRGGGTIRRGSTRSLTGTITGSGVPAERAPVAVYAAARAGGWKRLTTVRADVHGRLHVTVRPTRTTRYQARFGGTRSFGRATSRPVTVTVSPAR